MQRDVQGQRSSDSPQEEGPLRRGLDMRPMRDHRRRRPRIEKTHERKIQYHGTSRRLPKAFKVVHKATSDLSFIIELSIPLSHDTFFILMQILELHTI